VDFLRQKAFTCRPSFLLKLFTQPQPAVFVHTALSRPLQGESAALDGADKTSADSTNPIKAMLFMMISTQFLCS
jgi:hypothetical protein